jgi:hypothetical protein
MPWFKVDDNLAFHQKVLRAGNGAMGLWVRAGSWCAQQLSDGFVPTDIARTLGSRAEAKKLVDSTLWLEVDGGYSFWQWSEEGRQPTRAEVEEKRKATRERQRRAREKAQGVTASVTRDDERDIPRDDAVTDSVSHAAPDPTRPDPSVVPSELPVAASPPPKRGTRIPDGWKPTPADVEWQRSKGIDDFVARRQLEQFANYWRAKAGRDATKLDWSATWRNWLLREQERNPAAGTPPPAALPYDPLASARPRPGARR